MDTETISCKFLDKDAILVRDWKGEITKLKETQPERIIKLVKEDLKTLKN